jgi:DNA-binding GntR family transcriptional regulator
MPKLSHDQLSELVYQHLREQILNLEIPIGSRLIEETIAKDLEVSPTPVKAALAKLAHEELVTVEPRRGKYVKTPTKKDVDDVFQVRKALEVLAVESATPLMERSELERFLLELDEAEKALVGGNPGPAFDVDNRLHERIYCVQPNDLLRKFMSIIIGRIKLFRKMGARPSELSLNMRSLHKHRAIVQAMLDRDEKRAGREMAEHIDETREQALHDIRILFDGKRDRES